MTPLRRRRSPRLSPPCRRRPSSPAAVPPPPASGNPISEWILEFLLRQPISDFHANMAFSILPLSPPFSHRLKKTILLRRIASELSCRSVSERTLHSLELIEELDRLSSASRPSSSMKTAYCSVALDCAVRFLREEDESAFSDAVDRIWKCRLVDLEQSEAAELVVSDLVEDGRKALENALVSRRVKGGLLKWGTKEEALSAVQFYLKEATEGMGPSFLEMSAKAMGVLPLGSQERSPDGTDAMVLDGETTSGSPVHLLDKNKEDVPARGKDASGQGGCFVCEFDCLPTPEVSKVTEALKTSSAELQNMVQDPLPNAVTTAAEVAGRLGGENKPEEPNANGFLVDGNAAIHACEMNAEVGCAERSNTRTAGSKYCVVEQLCNLDGSRNSDTKESDGNQDVVTEVAQLQSVHEGADAIHQGGTSMSEVAPAQSVREGVDATHREGTSTSEVAPAQSVREGGDATHKEDTITTIERNKPSSRPRTRLMDRNPTARTLEWGDDSIESPTESSSNPSKRVRLPSPNRRVVSPLKLAQNITSRKRRKIKKWSVLEEDTLRKGVERHGAGNWKYIRNFYPEIFQDRTEVDLKDKWRNMTRH